jgi:hypothetical protein
VIIIPISCQLSLLAPVRVHHPDLRRTARIRLINNSSINIQDNPRSYRGAGSDLPGSGRVSFGAIQMLGSLRCTACAAGWESPVRLTSLYRFQSFVIRRDLTARVGETP